MFACDSSRPMPLIQVAQKIADLYGLKLGMDVAVKYID
jgi:hypothetical protein